MSSKRARNGQLTLEKRQLLEAKKKEINHLTKMITKQHQACLAAGIDLLRMWIICGMFLQRMKSLLNFGEFIPWIKNTPALKLTPRTAQRYMRVAAQFKEFLQNQGIELDANSDFAPYFEAPPFEQFRLELKSTPSLLLPSPESDSESKTRDELAVCVDGEICDEDEWELSPEVIAAVKMALGGTITTDPSALSIPGHPVLADLNLTRRDNGLADEATWMETAWVCPGQKADFHAWYEKTLDEIFRGNLKVAILCVPDSAAKLPGGLFNFPVAITPSPLTVTFFESGLGIERKLRSRSMFFYVSRQSPDIQKFAEAFGHIAGVFAPVASNGA